MSRILRALLSRNYMSVKSVEIPKCNISVTSYRRDKSEIPTETAKKPAGNPMDILQEGKYHRVDNLEKRFLVWSGKYKRVEDVPPTVPQETMEKSRNKARIKIANYMMLATVLACAAFIYSGKQAAKRGESVQKMNLDWHQHEKTGTQK